MKIGLHLPQIGAATEQIARAARRAEDTGYESIWAISAKSQPEAAELLNV